MNDSERPNSQKNRTAGTSSKQSVKIYAKLSLKYVELDSHMSTKLKTNSLALKFWMKCERKFYYTQDHIKMCQNAEKEVSLEKI